MIGRRIEGVGRLACVDQQAGRPQRRRNRSGVPVTEDVDSYRLEWAAAGGEDRKTGTEDAARHLFDELDYDFLICDPGARRFGLVVADDTPRIVRAAEES